MKTLKLTAVLCFVLASSVWAGSLPTKKNSSYGDSPGFAATVCLDSGGLETACGGSNVAITEVPFINSNFDHWVFEFEIDNLGDFGLTLTPATNCGNPSCTFDDAGAFVLDPDATAVNIITDLPVTPSCAEIGSSTVEVQVSGNTLFVPCGSDSVGTSTVNVSANNVFFNFPNGGNGLDVFVAEPVAGTASPPSSPLTALAGDTNACTSLSEPLCIGPAVATTPEPGSFVLVGSGLVAVVWLWRRRASSTGKS